jgi:uncharacterized protein YmfQ (DUF2313 family)
MARDPKDYLKLLLSLLPLGISWSRSPNSRIYEFLYSEAEELSRIDDRSQELIIEGQTKKTSELLNDYELDFGLPEVMPNGSINDPDLTDDERRSRLNAKLNLVGQQYKDYFLYIVDSYNYIGTIVEWSPCWTGLAICGDSCGKLANLFLWTLYVDLNDIEYDHGIFTTLQSNVDKYKPAHSIVETKVSSGFSMGFNKGYRSIPSQYEEWGEGGFSRGFAIGFNVKNGGGFDRGFNNGFNIRA